MNGLSMGRLTPHFFVDVPRGTSSKRPKRLKNRFHVKHSRIIAPLF